MSEPPQRAALTFVYFTGAALVGVSVLQLMLYFLDTRFNHRPLPVVPVILWSIPALAGIALLVKAKAVAQWISERLDQ